MVEGPYWFDLLPLDTRLDGFRALLEEVKGLSRLLCKDRIVVSDSAIMRIRIDSKVYLLER